MAVLTPEALGIVRYNPLQRGRAKEPLIAIANAATALEVYNEATEPPCWEIFLQNLSVTAVKYTYNGVAGEDGFHGVLAGGSAQDDGLGGNVVLKVRDNGYKSISLWCGGAAIRCLVAKIDRNPTPNSLNS